jgi:ATP-dependent RNA helicase DeaD
MTSEFPVPGFGDLGLSPALLQALSAVGYESPSPIQARTIPPLLAGSDVLGQAQTGTGKTAAFALPILARVDLNRAVPQALVLTPTRELAIQVAEAFQKYSAGLTGFHVLPVYGGQSYTPQLKGLKRGPHVVVGTPGRVVDHIKSGALQLGNLAFLVLDEGDEMLQMGFIEDIEWILGQTPPERQIALFSATMPSAIRRIAQKHMRSPVEITIQNRAGTTPKIRQRYWLVSGTHKLDALTRVLEVTRFDAMLIFVRTKIETVELADRLEARGFDAAALNGDIPQQQREKTVAQLRAGQLDIVVATDVAARGLDVERISHVLNYDIPYDPETYVHRIGRTGRAGRSGEAILFVAPRERNMLRIIERVTKQQIEPMALPSVADVNEQRVLKFKERIASAVQSGQGKPFEDLVRQIESEQNIPAIEIAASLAALLQGPTPLLLPQKAGAGTDRPVVDTESPGPARESNPTRAPASAPTPTPGRSSTPSPSRAPAPTASRSPAPGRRQESRQPRERVAAAEQSPRQQPAAEAERPRFPTEPFRLEVGRIHGVQPEDISNTLVSEAGLDPSYVGPIDIRDDHTVLALPKGMPEEIFRALKRVRLRGEELRISRLGSKQGKHKPGNAPRAKDEAGRGSSGTDGRFSKDRRKHRRDRRKA